MPALGVSSHSVTIAVPGTLETSRKKITAPSPHSGLAYSNYSKPIRGQSMMDLDFGAYLLSSSPPVNFAFSYSIDAGIPGGVHPEPWTGTKSDSNIGADCNGNTKKVNQYDYIKDYQRMNRWSADMSMNDIRGDFSPHLRGFRDVSPSLRTRKTGCVMNASNRSNNSVRSCLRTNSLRDSQSGDSNSDLKNIERSLDQIKRENRSNKKVSFADDIGRRLYVVRIFEESPDTPSFIDPASVLRHSQKNGNHAGQSRSNVINKNLPASVTFCHGNNGQLSQRSSSPTLSDSSDSSADALSSLSSSSEVESGEEGSQNCLLVPNFSMPAASYKSFRRKIEEQCVSLESVHQMESTGNLWGTIKVKEIAYEKLVFVRVTFDSWQTQEDVPAEYVVPTDAASLRGRTLPFATFSFRITLPANQFQLARHGVQFAVCYKSGGVEYWDNNAGCNYEFKCPDWAGNGSMTSSAGRRGLVENKDPVFSAAKTESWSAYASWAEVDASVPYW